MIDQAKEPMQHWAAARGLAYTAAGLLPPVTPTLDVALGAGEHRAGLVRTDTGRRISTVGGFTKRPERSTWNLCEGELPGGRRGVVAHHVALVQGYSGDDAGTWNAVPDTVVLVRVPGATRVARTRRFDAPPDLPGRTTIELRDGALCVAARGVHSDAATLDRLCRAAAGVAARLEAEAAALETVPADAPLPRAVLRARAGARAPASVAEARSTAETELRADPELRRFTRVRALARGLGSVAAAAAGAAAFDAVGLGLPGAVAAAAFVLVVIAPFAVWSSLREGRRELEREIAGTAAQLALDRFADGYARERGLVVEDRDALRRGVTAPLPGVPLRVWGGELVPGVRGRLALWVDNGDRDRTTYAVLALLPWDGDAAPDVDGHEAAVVGGSLAVWAPVGADDRSAQRLDALRAVLPVTARTLA